MKIKRISIGPGEIGGYFTNLKAGFDEINIPSEHFVLMPNKFGYQESNYFLKNVYVQVAKLRNVKVLPVIYLGLFLEATVRLFVLLYALIRCDIFIIPGFGSFFKFYELPLIKFLGKKIIVVYVGSDARPSYFSGKNLDDLKQPHDRSLLKKEVLKQVLFISKVEKYADLIINHTATAQFFERNFIRLQALGTPVRNNPSMVKSKPEHIGLTRILHAPSRPHAKGSEIFRQIIGELCEEGYKINLIELKGVPNSIVLNEMANCDFVLDELYSDAPMAMLGTEAAAFSKPVIVGGYYAEQYRIDNPSSQSPPTLYVQPSEIKTAIRKLIDDEEFRLDLGRRAFEFVTHDWSVNAVAKNYLRLIRNEPIPDNWVCNPTSLPYIWGWGLSKDNWRVQMSEYISHCGAESLMLDHNPELKQKILDEVKNFTL